MTTKPLKLIAFFLTLTTSLFCSAQDASVTAGEPFPLSQETIHRFTQNYIQLEDRILNTMVDIKINEFTFQLFTAPSYNLTTKKVVMESTKNLNYEYFQKIGEKVYLFYSIYEEATNTENLYVKEVDTELGGFIGTEKKIISLKNKLAGDLMNLNMTYSIQNKYIFTIVDTSSFSIFSDYKPEVKKNSNSIRKSHFTSFKNDFTKIVDIDYSIPLMEDQYSINQKLVDYEGNGYVSIKKWKLINGKLDKDQFDIVIYKVNNQGVKEIGEILSGNINFRNFDCTINNNNELAVLGFYSNSKDKVKSDGIFSGIYTNENKFNLKTTDFTRDFIVQYQKSNNDKSVSFENLKIISTVNLPEGGFLLSGCLIALSPTTGSTVYTHEVKHEPGTGMSVHEYKTSLQPLYTFGDIITFKLTETGEIIWQKKLARYHSNNLKIDFALNQKNLNIIYYDKKSNTLLKDNETPGNFDDQYKLTYHKISLDDGSVEILDAPMGIHKCGEQELKHYTPYIFFQLSEGRCIIQHQVKKANLVWFKVEFEE